MKKGFSARRVPRKVGQDEDERSTDDRGERDGPESTLIRPSSRPKKGSSLRTSFTPSALDDEESTATRVIPPNRSNRSKLAIQRNASKLSQPSLPSRHTDNEDDDRPSYTAASLQQLKDSTPTTPHDLSGSDIDQVSDETRALDISSKFGTSFSHYQRSSAIPSAAEIAEKKARRARLAQEQAADEYISLDPSDPELDNDNDDEDDNVTRDERGRLILKPKDKHNEGESRLVREDEDVMEGFEEFTEADANITFTRKSELQAAKKRKEEMAAQIAAAEGEHTSASNSDDDDSERERNEAFEAAQTSHGTSHNRTSVDPNTNARPRTPPKISPLPTLDGVIERLRKQVADMQTSRSQKLQEMEGLKREKIRLGEEEVRIQAALSEVGERFRVLREEKGIERSGVEEGREGGEGFWGARAGLGAGESGASTDVENVDGRGGLGFGGAMVGRGLESWGNSGVGTPMAVGGDSD